MEENLKQLLLKDLCARLPYGVKVRTPYNDAILRDIVDRKGVKTTIDYTDIVTDKQTYPIRYIKPYLRPMSSMTEEEAKELSILYGFKDILSIKITDEYIDVVVDDGVCSAETRTIWYDEIISSIEIFDWLNANHFDFRNLIERELAIDCTGLNVY